jgi:hypothetical protein
LFALIIGINNYHKDPFYGPLTGCVNDAKSVQNFLTKRLNVPEGNIKTLFNEDATRKAIVDGFRALAEKEEIKQDNPILIYYAGHGGRCKAPSGWLTQDSQIEMLVPYDFDTSLNNTYSAGHSPGGDGAGGEDDPLAGQGVWDLTLKSLLSNIAEKKGNNIVCVLSFVS